MKNLIIPALFAASATLTASAAPFELCVSGTLSSTVAPAKGPEITVTDCVWDDGAVIQVNATTATSLVISGGSTLGTARIKLFPTNPFALIFKNGFSASDGLKFEGELVAGSSISITDCLFSGTRADSVDFYSFTMTGTTFDLHRNYLACLGSSASEVLSIPESFLSTVRLSDNTFNHSSGSSFYAVNADAGYFVSSSFEARRNRILSNGYSSVDGFYISSDSYMSSVGLSDALGFKAQHAVEGKFAAIDSGKKAQTEDRDGKKRKKSSKKRSQRRREHNQGAGRAFNPATAPTDWSTVTEEEARNTYGKSTFVLADNTFENMQRPWVVYDNEGFDYEISGNVATVTVADSTVNVVPPYEFYGDYYRSKVVIRNNVLSSNANGYARIRLEVGALANNSVLLVEQNKVTSGFEGNSAQLVRLSDSNFVPQSSLFVLRNNELIAANASAVNNETKGLLMYHDYSFYTPEELARVSQSNPLVACGNTIFGVLINTDELLANSVDSENNATLPLYPDSDCKAETKSPANAAPSIATSMAATVIALALSTTLLVLA